LPPLFNKGWLASSKREGEYEQEEKNGGYLCIKKKEGRSPASKGGGSAVDESNCEKAIQHLAKEKVIEKGGEASQLRRHPAHAKRPKGIKTY